MADLLIFFPEEQAREALVVFDCDDDGHISAEDLRDAVLQIYENRWCFKSACHASTSCTCRMCMPETLTSRGLTWLFDTHMNCIVTGRTCQQC